MQSLMALGTDVLQRELHRDVFSVLLKLTRSVGMVTECRSRSVTPKRLQRSIERDTNNEIICLRLHCLRMGEVPITKI